MAKAIIENSYANSEDRAGLIKELTTDLNKLIKLDDPASAYPLLLQLSRLSPDTTTYHSTAGLVAMRLNRVAAALTHFKLAQKTSPDDFDTNYNLALIEKISGHSKSAISRLLHLRKKEPDNSKLLNDIAIIWSERKNYGRALVVFRRGMMLNPNDSQTRNNAMQICLEQDLIEPGLKILERQEELTTLEKKSIAEIHRWNEILKEAKDTIEQNNLEQKYEIDSKKSDSIIKPHSVVAPLLIDNNKKPKIAFFATHQAFLKDIIASLSEKYECRLFDGNTVEALEALMSWSDLSWFEWCDDLVIQGTKLPKCCKIICRLHSYEAFTDMPSQVDWSKVDHLMFVNQSVLELFKRQVDALVPVSVVHNGVDLTKFSIPLNKKPSKKIASVGYINYKKNPTLLLYAFSKIYKYDQEFSLHIAGSHQDSRIELYFHQYLKGKDLPVYFDGWIEDMPSWYADKGYVISTSLFESFHYSIAEGMTSGLMPLIHNWYGAEHLYPKEYLYDDPDDCLELLMRLEKIDIETTRLNNRKYINRRYNQSDKVQEIKTIINRLLPENNSLNVVSGNLVSRERKDD